MYSKPRPYLIRTTTRIARALARVVAVCICVAGVPMPAAQAELIATDRAEPSAHAQTSARAALTSLLDRADVRAALESRGVSAEEAKARVAALSDDEAEQLAAKLDSLPAGGGGFETVLWIGFLVFVILLITDILGFTKVFPFTRPAK
ncbi:MAG TPA: PA2779 family protein [Burkholderiales bacterium]|nr:PA2779 family protein [Burkholderiales bacterium]